MSFHDFFYICALRRGKEYEKSIYENTTGYYCGRIIYYTVFCWRSVLLIYSGSRSGFVYRRFRECLGGFVMVVIVYCFQ